jgi:hypothetical protein
MGESRTEQTGSQQDREIWKGLVSGLVGGLAATLAMTQYQVNATKLINKARHAEPEQQESGESTPVLLADRISNTIAGRPVPTELRGMAGNLVHYGFGTLMGGIYGVLSELLPVATAGRGAAYGAAMWAAVDELALPASGVAEWWPAYPIHVHANALGAHLVYGTALDGARRGVRALLDRGTSQVEESAYFRTPQKGRRTASSSLRRFSRFGLEGKKTAA